MKKLAHHISSNNFCSRRNAEELIKSGKVFVNGEQIINVAIRVEENDKIEIDGVLLKKLEQPKVWLYYKPVHVVTTHSQEDGKRTVFDMVRERLGYVLSVGRLDYMSEGLLLLTNSNEIAHDLMNNNYKRVYKVLVDYVPENIKYLEEDFSLNGIHYKAWKIVNVHNNWITLELYEGKNREIRRVLDGFGTTVYRLIRVQYGPYKVEGGPNDLFEADISKIKLPS